MQQVVVVVFMFETITQKMLKNIQSGLTVH